MFSCRERDRNIVLAIAIVVLLCVVAIHFGKYPKAGPIQLTNTRLDVGGNVTGNTTELSMETTTTGSTVREVSPWHDATSSSPSITGRT